MLRQPLAGGSQHQVTSIRIAGPSVRKPCSDSLWSTDQELFSHCQAVGGTEPGGLGFLLLSWILKNGGFRGHAVDVPSCSTSDWVLQ